MRLKLLISLAFLLASGCASMQPAEPVVTVPAEDPEPALAVPEVYAQEPTPVAPEVAEPVVKTYSTVMERVVDNFALESCQNHQSALDWAQWYADRPAYLERIFARAEPWLFYIAEEVERRNMPGEFVLFPVIESAFDPFAFSSGRAVGTWQFISATGKRYGLDQNWWYDGRRDVYAATQSALQYLQDMAAMFDGDYVLAMAGYNSGEGRVGRQIKRNRAAGLPATYWDLKLPRETRGYVPKLLGLQCLFQNPEQYGIELPTIPNKPVIRTVDTHNQADLVIAAQMADIPVYDLFRLNAGFNRWATDPDGPHRLVLPIENADLFEEKLALLDNDALMRWDQITVQEGDTLGKLAIEHNIPLSVLRSANENSGDFIRIGQKLRLPREGTDRIDPLYANAASELQTMQARLVAPSRRSHRVRPGESLSVIARRYRVSVNDLKRWNNISDAHKIRAGKELMIFQTPVAPNPPNKSATRHTVQRGDTLWDIARRYRLDVNDLMRWNNLDAKSILHPGQRLNLAL